MKKNILGTLAIAFGSIFIFAACTAVPASPPQTESSDLILAAKGEITNIETDGDTASLTIDGSGVESDAAYQLLIVHPTNETPLIENGNASAYEPASLQVGDKIAVFLSPNAPVTASEPPQATPEKIVVTERAAQGAGTESSASADVKTEYEGSITEITPDGDYYLVYLQKEENGEPAHDLRAVVSSDTEIVSEKREASGLAPNELKIGDKVTVTTNGIATFSIPPQASAQKIVIHDAQEK
ncbi:hypothetical protein CE91St36_13970 [Christensenellaceae bacterium]|nr:hypothetical protein CE91St36_13970 [Christensenellaceae bacterium]BDF61248.1 hypothetical protein CE91St37_13980 [Christensenellaceae bacterium]